MSAGSSIVCSAFVGHDRGADGEELDHVRAPAVASLLDLHADDALGLDGLGLGLHPLHRQLARVVERLGEVLHLDVLADLREPAAQALVGDVVDAAPHAHADRPVAGLEQRPEVLAREVARERAPVGRAVELAAAVLDGRPDRDELGQVGAPLVPADVEPHADDPVGAELVGLLLHARHRQLAGVVHRLGQHVHLLVLAPVRLLEPDVVDRAPDDQPERVEPRLLHEQELAHREVGGEEAGLVLGQAAARVLGDALERGGVVAHGGRLLVRRSGRWSVWRPGSAPSRRCRWPGRGACT